MSHAKNINIRMKTQAARPKDKKSLEKKTSGKENTFINPATSKNQNNAGKQTESRMAVQPRSTESINATRTSLLSDMTRGRSSSRSLKVQVQED